jgi:two-component system phosphate regulon sensor histidine kinase PhoR
MKNSQIDPEVLLQFLDFLKEGVIVVGENQNIEYMNAYAKDILKNDIKGIDPVGKHFSEVIKNNYLYSIISYKNKRDFKEEITINNDIFLVRMYHINSKKVLHFQDITLFEIYKQAKKDFVSNVSHELKTPIAVMKGIVETLEQEKDIQTIKKFLSMAKKRIDQMDSLINDLLILAKLESKEEKLNITKADLSRVVNSIFNDLEHLSKEKSIKLINLVPEGFIIEVDHKKFNILLKNLIENAIKYNKTEGSVTVSAERKNGEILINVTDTGIGIPKEFQPLIFERFYRVDKSRSRNVGGTGLGLSIVKHIAEAHKGKVEVKSELNIGSTFTVRIPERKNG